MQQEHPLGEKEITVDVVIVGSGASGLSAAVRSRALGLDPLVIDVADRFGGTVPLSSGALWIPDNPVMRAAGVDDSVEAGLRYLEECVGDAGPVTSHARKRAFVREGPRLVEFLMKHGVDFQYSDPYPDYFPELPGGHERGRIILPRPFDLRRLGSWSGQVATVPGFKMKLLVNSVREVMDLPFAGVAPQGRHALAAVLSRTLWSKALGRDEVSLGQALVAHVLLVAQRLGVRFAPRTALRDLIVENGEVVGVTVRAGGRTRTVRTRRGVVLAAGGFARNEEWRKRYHPQPSSAQWTTVGPHDAGDGIRAALEVGAATALMDEAIWTPVSVLPDGNVAGTVWERETPYCIMVNGHGDRFCNESANYMEIGRKMYEQDNASWWLIMDGRHRRRYPYGDALPGRDPKKWLRSGYLRKADSLAELAGLCGLPPERLRATVERFNKMADAGVDEDFGRARSAYDRSGGDQGHRPDPNLGALREAPFYAVRQFPGDTGTAGGLLTDEHARVVGEDGSAIGGLYAAGSTAARMTGRVYPGGGASLATAMVFGFIAANHAADRVPADR
ncbi:FAD-binding protein [Streptomyces sp. NBC_00893]|uniref:FAD-binding protein n=1 Tax=Streptomyces sp. NBC_00893 TaxID=2975862 RepID=UPI0022598F9E|nr:FAD-binding protein [Streptomyces sp. NBC_00893]MCX4849536.1 FAD-binding protein [Streptomyces sp. NBC_00893]